MTDRRQVLAVGAAALGSAFAGVAVWRMFRPSTTETQALYALQLPDAEGRPQALSQWRGRVLVANFWATWCEPCREEMPALVSAQDAWRSKGVQIVGIGIDTAAKIREFAANFKITYPLLVAGPEVLDLARGLGNAAGGLPYTVVLSPDGSLSERHLGALRRGELDQFLRRATAKA